MAVAHLAALVHLMLAETPVRLAVDEIDLIECKGHWRWLPPAAEVSQVAAKELPQALP